MAMWPIVWLDVLSASYYPAAHPSISPGSCVCSMVLPLYLGDKPRKIFRLLIAETEVSRDRAGSQIRGLDSRPERFAFK